MSDSVQPHRQQPTRLPCPWDSPVKNTGVRCHFLLQCMRVKSEREVAQSCLTLCDPMDCSLLGSSIHGIFQAKRLNQLQYMDSIWILIQRDGLKKHLWDKSRNSHSWDIWCYYGTIFWGMIMALWYVILKSALRKRYVPNYSWMKWYDTWDLPWNNLGWRRESRNRDEAH